MKLLSFQDAFRLYEDMKARHDTERSRYNEAYRSAVVAAAKRAHPKKRIRDSNDAFKRASDVAKVIRNHCDRAAKGIMDRQDKERKRIERVLIARAQKTPLCPSSTCWSRLDVIWSSTYSTQTRPRAYAEGSAKIRAIEIQAQGIPVHVRVTNEQGGTWSYVAADFEIWVALEPWEVEILKRKPGLTTREWVKACWQNGCNPRVYNPFLPAGYEERVGIDYQGRELNIRHG